MASGKSKWTTKRTERQKENWAKARKRDEDRPKRANGQNVAPGTFNGHSVGGYSIAKHGKEQAEKLAALHTRSMTDRREARRNAKKRRAVTPKTEEVAA